MTAPSHTHLAVALDGAGWHPAAWREPNARPAELFTAAYWTDLVATAERGLLDFVTIEDSLTIAGNPYVPRNPDAADEVQARLDAHLIAARVAPITRHIGLVPTITTTHTEPFHVSKALATLDFTSLGRAGWQVKVSGTPDEAQNFGRREVPGLDKTDREKLAHIDPPEFVLDLFAEAADAVEVVRRLWDSWEDDAEIREVDTRRFIDRDKLHYIDFEGRFFSVRGPSITPRSPQGQPVVTALAHRDFAYDLATKTADVVFVTPTDDTVQSTLADVAQSAERVGRHGDPIKVYADIVVFLDSPEESGADRLARLDAAAGRPLVSDALVFTGSAAQLVDRLAAWREHGIDGFRLRPGVAVDDLNRIATAVVPELQSRDLFRTEYADGNLRSLLDLPATVPNRYAAQAVSV